MALVVGERSLGRSIKIRGFYFRFPIYLIFDFTHRSWIYDFGTIIPKRMDPSEISLLCVKSKIK
jgi:hypothetical protein